jgi:hypothetical protein
VRALAIGDTTEMTRGTTRTAAALTSVPIIGRCAVVAIGLF